jgi:two-component system nitrogen regulation response regulator NtrX
MQLFGFDKKHLIGVEEVQKGHLDLAQNGTLYLKEISYLNEETQRKILKLIQTQAFMRVGQSKPIPADVRLLLSSTHDLKARVKSGEFLSELHAAISDSVLFVPALKDRKDDIPVLIQHFSDFYAQESGTRAKIFETDAIEALMRYTWPGHVRELKNFVERVYILLEDDKVTAALLVEEGLIAGGNQEAMHASQLKVARSMFEKQYILRKLEENNGNVSKTAEMIGLERSHLHRKMKTYGIET